MIISPELSDFIGQQVVNCDMKSITVLTDESSSFRDDLVNVVSGFNLPFVHLDGDTTTTSELRDSIRTIYNRHDNLARYFIVATRNPEDVLDAAESAFEEEFSGLLALLPHRTRWMVISWTCDQWDSVTGQQVGSVLDNVAVVQVGSSNALSPGQVEIIEVSTFMWRENRTREPSVIAWRPLPSEPKNTNCTLFPNRNSGLNGRTLVVAAKEYIKVYLEFKEQDLNGSRGQEGMLVDILDFCADGLNFTYRLVDDISSTHTISWIYYRQVISNGQVDIGLSPWSNLFGNIFDDNSSFSYPVMFDKIVGIYRRPPKSLFYDMIFIFPYPPIIYAYFIIAVITATTLYSILVNVIYESDKSETMTTTPTRDDESPQHSGQEKKRKKRKEDGMVINRVLNHLDLFFVFMASLMNQGYLPRPSQGSARILIASWSLGIVFFYALYSSIVTAERIRQVDEVPFKTFEEFLQTHDYRGVSAENSVVEQSIRAAKNDTLLARLKDKVSFIDTDECGPIDKTYSSYLDSLEYNTVFIFNELLIKIWLQSRNDKDEYVIMTSDPLFSSHISIMFPFQSELNRLISNEFLVLYHSGIDIRIRKRYSQPHNSTGRSQNGKMDKHVEIQISEMVWLFLVCLALLVIASVVLLIEVKVKRMGKRRTDENNDKGRSLWSWFLYCRK